MSRVKSPPSWLVEGAMVDYHSVIGGPITQFNMRARTSPQKMGRGGWVVWLDGKSDCVSVYACTPATGSLGPSNDDSTAVEVEMRAAELLVSALGGWNDRELSGWSAHRIKSDLVDSLDIEAGWLACEMSTHEERDQRDATAWSWDISRPLAEQLAETAAALEPTDVIAQDPTDDAGDAQ